LIEQSKKHEQKIQTELRIDNFPSLSDLYRSKKDLHKSKWSNSKK